MTIRTMNAGQSKDYVSPAIETLTLQCEQAIMTGSGDYGLPGEEPFVNDFGNF